MADQYLTHVVQLVVVPAGHSINSERATSVEIHDEGGGAFVEVVQHSRGEAGIAIDPDEWSAIRDAIERMLTEAAGMGSDD